MCLMERILTRVHHHLCDPPRPLLLVVNKMDVLPNSTHPTGKLGKEALAQVTN